MNYRHTKSFIGFLLLAILIASPLATFAKEKENHGKGNKNKEAPKVQLISAAAQAQIKGKGAEKKAEKAEKSEKSDKQEKENRQDNDDNDREDNDREVKTATSSGSVKKCFQAWGHLIAPGWLKKNGFPQIGVDCHLPFGIGKKWTGNNASTTPDVTAPVISSITIAPAKTQAEVRWTTNENSNSTVFWSLTSPVDLTSSATKSVTHNSLIKDHRIVIKNLTASTTYYVVVRSRDAAGNVTTSETKSFMTMAPTPDASAPAISNVVTLTSTSTIKVGWMTNENTTGRVFYSTVLPVALSGSGASFVDATSTQKSHTVTIPGLNSDTTYYLVVEATDTSGNVSTSATFSAKTAVATSSDVTAPVISALASAPGLSTSTISWTTNEAATSKVYYSTINPVNLASALSLSDASLVTGHSLTLAGLSASTTYYVVVESKDAAGNTSTSTGSFTTNMAPDTTDPIISSVNVSVGTSTAAVTWTTNEAATSQVFYSTSTPLNLATASTASNMSLVTGHTLSLTGLATSTQYYFLVRSTDAAGNTATSSQFSAITGSGL